jgi:hypothetical protein
MGLIFLGGCGKMVRRNVFRRNGFGLRRRQRRRGLGRLPQLFVLVSTRRRIVLTLRALWDWLILRWAPLPRWSRSKMCLSPSLQSVLRLA